MYFIENKTPFNRQDGIVICDDKDVSYTLLKNIVNIPKWKSYLAPNCNEDFRKLLEFKDVDSIVKDIKRNFSFPVIIKKNKGSRGANVFLCKNIKEVKFAVKKIFSRNSFQYDYLAIAEDYININNEYRVIAYKEKVLLVYEKDFSKAKFTGNLSPLHWKNARAIMIKDKNLINRIQKFINPIFKVVPINFVGIDLVIDNTGKMFIIELNKAPGFELFARDNGIEPLKDMLKIILKDIMKNEK